MHKKSKKWAGLVTLLASTTLASTVTTTVLADSGLQDNKTVDPIERSENLSSSVETVKPNETVEVSSETVVERNWAEYYSSFKNPDEISKVERENVSIQEDVVYADEPVEVVLPYDENYIPDSKKVSEHFISYLNELKEINNLPTTPVNHDAKYDVLSTFAEEYSARLANKEIEGHIPGDEKIKLESSGIYVTDDYEGYIGKYGYNIKYLDNPNNDQKVVYSDQELAYRMLLDYYSDYSSTSASADPKVKYGHRLGLLFFTDEYTVMSAKTNEKGEIRTTLIFASGSQSSRHSSHLNKYINTLVEPVYHAHGPVDKPAVLSEDKINNNLLYKGEQLKFLPNTTFKYVNETTKVSKTVFVETEFGVEQYKVITVDGREISRQLLEPSYKNVARTETLIESETEYRANDQLEFDKRVIEQVGQSGKLVTGVKYTVNDEGELLVTDFSKDSTEPIKHIIQVGTKPVTIEQNIDFGTIYVADANLKAGEKLPVSEGEKGEETVTTTYLVDSKGNVTSNVAKTERTKEPIDAVIKVGTKPIEKTTSVPFAIVYQPDETLALKETEIKVVGVEGESTETISYQLNKATGEVTSVTSEPVITKAPVTQVVLVGVKPTKTTQPVPFSTTYEEDPSLEVGQTKIKVQGVNGEAEVTTSYLLDTVSGQVTPGTSTTVTIKAPVTQIELVGKKVVPVVTTIWRQTATGAEHVEVTSVNGQVIGEKVLDTKVSTRQETTIPFKIELFEDETKVKGSKVLVQKGIDGKQTTGVIYTVVNGELVTTPLNDVVEPVTERIAMGTKPDSQSVQINKPVVNETKKSVVSPIASTTPNHEAVKPAVSVTQAVVSSQKTQASKASLPNTGEKETISTALGVSVLSMALGLISFKKREN